MHLVYRVARHVASLGEIFQAIEQNKQHLKIREYSLSETTLDQIFLHLARKQDEEEIDME